MARHGENIYKRRDGRYEGRYVVGKRPNGTTKFGYVLGRQYGDVRRRLMLKKAEQAARNEYRCRGDGRSFGSWLTRWLENGQADIKRSSRRTYANLARRILPRLGGVALKDITPDIVRGFLEDMERDGLSASTVGAAYRLLSAAMRAAQDEGLISANPCRRIRPQRAEHREQRVLSRSEQDMVCAAAMGEKDLPALLSLYTGMRLGEICALKWRDVDWEKRAISVRRTVQRLAGGDSGARTALAIDAPKSQSSRRTLPIPEFLMEKLRQMYGDGAAGFIFGSGDRPAEPRTVQRRFKRMAEKLGIEDAHFHTLRHSFATRLLELGVDVKTVSVLLGHGSAQTTLNFYAHSLMESQREALEKLAGTALKKPPRRMK